MGRPRKDAQAARQKQQAMPVQPAIAPIVASSSTAPIHPALLSQQQQQQQQLQPPQQLPQTIAIDRQNFLTVRDSVYARLSTIQDLIKSFSVDYLRQTNLLLGEPTSFENGGELEHIQNAFNGLMPNLMPQQFAPVLGEKKERKKRTHDPNAPKRPLTPYFLYMQTARPIIASDLGEKEPKGAVQLEGQRRWAVMPPGEKQGWNHAYAYNLRLYHARVHSYKHGNPDAKNMTDDEALKYAEDNDIKMPDTDAAAVEDVHVPTDQEAIADQLLQSAAANLADDDEDDEEEAKEEEPQEEEEEEEEEEEIPVPKSKSSRKRKGDAAAATAASSSPDKKRKRTSKALEADEPKKSGRKRSKA